MGLGIFGRMAGMGAGIAGAMTPQFGGAPGFGLGPALAKAVAGQTGQLLGKRKKKGKGTLQAPAAMTEGITPPNGGSY
jgi:hypothetical protein